MIEVETYLASVAVQVRGAGADRLSDELRDHLDDTIAHHVASGCDPSDAACIALERIGSADDVLVAWKSHLRARRAQTRRRGALVAFAVVTASALALVQHASGRQPASGDRTATLPAPTASRCPAPGKSSFRASFCLSRVGRTAHCRRASGCR